MTRANAIRRILFLDTETTGLPVNKWKSADKMPKNWPDIVSVAWQIYEDKKLVSKQYFLIKPEGWLIHPESTKIHGITQIDAETNGYDFESVMNTLKDDLTTCDTVVAHNLEFDKNVIYNAYIWRLNDQPTRFWPKNEICTMNKSETELKLPQTYPNSKKLYKSPRLDELYYATFNSYPEKAAHNSERDVEVLASIFWKRWINN
jgi:DNA polymerase III epsilon subunit-like protein